MLPFLVIIGLFLLLSILGGNSVVPQAKKHCRVHKWQYNDQNQLKCNECGYIAGTYNSDE